VVTDGSSKKRERVARKNKKQVQGMMKTMTSRASYMVTGPCTRHEQNDVWQGMVVRVTVAERRLGIALSPVLEPFRARGAIVTGFFADDFLGIRAVVLRNSPVSTHVSKGKGKEK
jgi:hypothetical protein